MPFYISLMSITPMIFLLAMPLILLALILFLSYNSINTKGGYTISKDRIEIPMNKIRLVIAMLFFIFIIFGGNWVLELRDYKPNRYNNISVLLTGVGLIALGIMYSILVFVKFISNKSGLIIDNLGITLNSSFTMLGCERVPWED